MIGNHRMTPLIPHTNHVLGAILSVSAFDFDPNLKTFDGKHGAAETRARTRGCAVGDRLPPCLTTERRSSFLLVSRLSQGNKCLAEEEWERKILVCNTPPHTPEVVPEGLVRDVGVDEADGVQHVLPERHLGNGSSGAGGFLPFLRGPKIELVTGFPNYFLTNRKINETVLWRFLWR